MRAGQGQTLIDVAAQVCGSAELAWDIAVRSGFGLTDIPGNAELDVPTDGGDRDTAAEMAASDAKPATDGTPRRDRIVPMPYMCLLRGFFVPSFESLQHPENQKYPQNTIKNKQLSEYQSLTK